MFEVIFRWANVNSFWVKRKLDGRVAFKLVGIIVFELEVVICWASFKLFWYKWKRAACSMSGLSEISFASLWLVICSASEFGIWVKRTSGPWSILKLSISLIGYFTVVICSAVMLSIRCSTSKWNNKIRSAQCDKRLAVVGPNGTMFFKNRYKDPVMGYDCKFHEISD